MIWGQPTISMWPAEPKESTVPPTATVAPAATTTDTAAQALEPPATLTNRDLAIREIMMQVEQTEDTVTGFVDSILEKVGAGRASWHPGQAWLDDYHDAVFAIVMPDDTIADPGSPHARLQDACSDIAGKPVTLTHTRTRRGKAICCALEVEFLT